MGVHSDRRRRRLVMRGLTTMLTIFFLAAVTMPYAAARTNAHPARAMSQARARPAGALFAGLTTQGWPSFFRISKNARNLVVANIGLHLKCTSGGDYSISDQFVRVPIGANGRLHAEYALPPTKTQDGTIVGGSSKLSAQLGHGHAKLSGVWQMHTTFIEPGGRTDECDSGPARFNAIK